MPPSAASSGSANRRRSRSSPRSNSRRASSPTTKKKNVIRPLFTHWRRSRATSAPPRSIRRSVLQSESYEAAWTFTQARAATAAANKTAAPPVSVRRNSRRGVSRLRAHAVRPENAGEVAVEAVLLLVALDHLGRSGAGRVRVASGFAQGAALAQQVPALVERDPQRTKAPPV